MKKAIIGGVIIVVFLVIFLTKNESNYQERFTFPLDKDPIKQTMNSSPFLLYPSGDALLRRAFK